MAVETSVILRSILLQVKKAKSIKEIEASVEAMCSKDDIDAVNASMQKIRESEEPAV